MTRRARLLTAVGSAGILCGAALVPFVHGTSAAAPGDDPVACPAPFPADELTEGMGATGLTTAGHYRGGPTPSSKRTPEEFEGSYVGTVEGDTGDLFLFDLSGSRITDADGDIDAGIWAGISGSPLYAADGRLIGSVSYSFTGTAGSTIAGVTPAADLYDLLAETGDASAARVRLDKSEQTMLRRAGVPAKVAAAGLVRLSTPKMVGGLAGMPAAMVEAMARKSGVAMPRLAGSTGAQDEEIPIVAGGNVAVANSHGSVALYSVGTATAVCDDVVIGYGHSNDWAPFGATIHGAETAAIIADGAASYKMANLGAPMGTLLHDRLNGVTGRLGQLPEGTRVTVTSTGPKGRTTESVVSEPDALSFVIGNQVYRDAALTLDELAAGTATISWDITFTRADGSSETFTRSQVYASDFSIADEVPSGVAGDVDAILDNGFEDVTITDVAVRQDVSRSYRAYRFDKIEIRSGGKWRTVHGYGRINARPGKALKVRVQLQRAGRKAQVTPVTRTFRFRVPKNAAGMGVLSVSGNGTSFWDLEDMYFELEEELEGTEPTTLDGLLEQLSASPRQDSLTATLDVMTKRGRAVTRTRQWKPGAVTFGDSTVRVKLPAPKPKLPKKRR